MNNEKAASGDAAYVGVNSEDYTIIELRRWLRRLELPMNGNKATLLMRLNELTPEERGECPGADELNDEVQSVQSSASVENDCQYAAQNSDDLTRELNLLKRERDLLQRENELLKREMMMKEQPPISTVNAESVQSTPFGLIKELVPDFDDNSNFDLWAKQIKSVAETYCLSENVMRALIISKLKGKALNWLHGNIDCASYDVDQLLTLLEDVFGRRENKLVLRQRFEGRKWTVGESFADYFNEKNIMASGLQLDEDELVDYLIEGIPDEQLRVQAFMQCFKSKALLLQAFSKVQLKQGRKTTPKVQDPNTRCFNCNSVGHWKAECMKPKREPGTCYGCGDKNHMISDCPERKPTISNLERNNYVSLVKFGFVIDNSYVFSHLEVLIDTGSPVSIIKKQSLPLRAEFELLSCMKKAEQFYGINKTKLKIFGKICCIAIIDNFEVSLDLMVVADDTMSYDAILGRDFLLKTNSKLIMNFSDKNELEQANNNTNLDINQEQFDTFDNDLRTKCLADGKRTILAKELEFESKLLQQKKENVCDFLDSEIRQNINDCDLISQNVSLSNDETNFMNLNLDNVNDCVNIGDAVVWRSNERFINIFNENYLLPERPLIPESKCEMRLVLNSQKPFSCCPRRISYAEKNELKKILDDYLEKGYIRPSNSEYASAIVLVRKKSGELRMCVDFRNLNKITAKDNYPIPIIDDLLDKLAKKRIFTKLDLKNGFLHVFMHQESIKLTSFVTPLGQYEFLRMPFGLKNAPSVFQRFVNSIFSDMMHKEQVIIYLDDIMVATDNFEEHLEVLTEVFKRLVRNKLELRLDKCEFLYSSVKYLGYLVSCEGIQADEKGLQAIKAFPVPNKVHNVQSFLGLCSYFRRFIKNFSTMAKPLYDLTKKNTKFKFGIRELECFELLKSKLLESPVLALYDPNSETELHCDASSEGFGAILLQKGQDNKFHPVFYFSKRTSEAESRYHSFELETLAIVYALQRFRIYLHRKKFKIVTDCNSLTQTLNKKELNPRIARWALELYNFDYVLEHRSNNRMRHVDALSRSTNIMVLETNTFEENLIICQNNDKRIKTLKKNLEKNENKTYEMRNGVVYRKKDRENVLFYVPEEMEHHVIYKYHDEMGHIGIDKVIELILKSYWFPELRKKVTDHVKNCLKCIVFSSKQGRQEGFLHNIPKGNKPFEIVHIDHYGPIDSNIKTKKYILVVIDAFTKFVRLYSAKTTASKEAINALSDYFRAYSRPKFIISDRGTCFTSKEFDDFLAANNVKHIKVATACPQANGQVERVNRIIKPMLAKLEDRHNHLEWYKVVEIVEFSLNNSVHKATGEHPSVLLFGASQRGKNVDLFKENLQKILNIDKKYNLVKIRKRAQLKQNKLQLYNKKFVDKKRIRPTKYNVGDFVMIKNFDSHVGAPRKLMPKFKGPYRVFKALRHDRYVLKDIDGFQQTQIPYVGTWAVSNIRPWIKKNCYTKKKRKTLRSGDLDSQDGRL